MKGLQDAFPIVIFVLVILAQVIAGVLKAARAKAQHKAGDDTEAERKRALEVQADIRRRIAERRQGGPMPVEQPPRLPSPPILRRAETTQMPEPIGGTLRRILQEMKQPAPPPPPEPSHAELHRRAELERQQRLADEMNALQQARVERRAAHAVAEQKRDDASEKSLLNEARSRTLAEIRDPKALRRAFVLREILGQPVGLR